MRKYVLFFLAFAILLSGGVAFAWLEPKDPGIKEQSKVTVSEPVYVYRLVRNPINDEPNWGNMVSSEVVVWDVISDDGVTVNYTTKVGITTSTDAIAGVVVGGIPTSNTAAANGARDDIGDRNWGYICVYGGPVLVSFDTSVVNAGEGFRADLLKGAATAAGPDGAGGSAGFAFDDTSTAGAYEAFVHIR
jgi:hypothetical protein